MIKLKKIGMWMIFSIFLTIIIFNIIDFKAIAAVTLPTEYYFVFNGQNKPAGSEYEMKMPEVVLNVTAGTWETDTTVSWISSETNVVELKANSNGTNFITLVRKGPGYSTITAVIKSGSSSYSISCLVKVGLEFDYQKTGMTTATTTDERILVLDDDTTKPVYLKYVDYLANEQDTTSTVTGSAITATAVNWESSNEGVATVNSAGIVTAVGAGTSKITVTSNTLSSQDKPMSISMNVVVSPKFSLSFTDASNNPVTYNSVNDNKSNAGIVSGVPSNFVITSNAQIGTNLTWKVYDSDGKLVSPDTSSKMNYSVSAISGNVSFSNVKAGTYEIYAFANNAYNANTNAPYGYMKIIVPISLDDINIVMNVGDTYNLVDNSNIPGVGTFSGIEYTTGNQNIALFNASNYIITAKSKGNVSIKLTYNTSQTFYDDSITIPDMTINITVIDGITLSASSATIYTKSTLLLNAIVTDPTVGVTWTSSDTAIATVVDGLVTGVKAGTTTITAKQTINGVVKKAICIITVQQSVTTITINPTSKVIAIDEYLTMHATITPNLSNINLIWKSSNDKVVKITESSALTATVQGVAGGTAVIMAVNQDNVVVGYCQVTVRQPVTSIVLSETTAIVSMSAKTLQLRASVYPDNAYDKTVKWTSSDTTKATVDANGLVTFKKAGNVTIIATSVDSSSITTICNLTIEVPVVSITLDETVKTMFVGQTARLTYAILPTNASNTTVTWTSTNTSVVTVDGTGKVTAKGVGTSVIILKAADSGSTVYCTITVKQVATTIKFDVSELKLKINEYYYIKTTLTPKDSTENDLVWESSDTKVATVDVDGKVIAKGAGSAIIMARTEAGGVAYCNVTVTQPVTGLILNFSEKTIYVDAEFKLEVSISPSSANQLGVNWKSSNTKVATVNNKGEVTGILGGTAIITCTTVEGGFKDTCVVIVKEPVTTVKLDHDSYNLGLGKTFMLTATVTNETATNKKVIWTSSNNKIVTVSSKGKITGIKAGYATITATAADGSEVEDSCEIRVVTPVTSITINKSYMTMMVGATSTLKATIKPTTSTFKKAKWTSSDSAVAIVDDSGVVTALKAGSATIVAEAQDNSGKKVICYVVVYDRVPASSITLQDKKLTMVSGEQKVVQLVLSPTTSTDGYSWSTDNPAVASVNKKTGRITAKSTGTAYITVMTDSGKTATVEVTVIGLNMTEITLEQYTSYPYPLEVEGATTSVKWTIDNPQIAVVTNGYISTRSVGTATITAVVNGRKLKCKLTVVKIK